MDRNLGLTAVSPSEDLMFPRSYDHYYPLTAYDHGVLDLYHVPWMNVLRRRNDGTVNVDENSFKVIIDVHQFKPDEVSVKLIDRWLVIQAKHEETKDKLDSVSRQFVRRYQLPVRADVDRVTSTISSDSVLTVTVPLKPKEEKQVDERVIKIELTGQPVLRKDGGNQEPITEIPSATTPSTAKNTVENEIREELTTQEQQEDAKPEK